MKKSINRSKEIKKSILPPGMNALISTAFPGVGQMFAREVKRGLILLMSFLTIGGLLLWRILVTGRRYEGLLLKFQKAYYLQPILIGITVLFGLFYIWNVIDAYIVSAKRNQGQKYENAAALLFFLIVIYFILGWQIGEIDVVLFVSRADEAVPTLSRVVWPWKAAVHFPEEFKVVKTQILVPCDNVEFPEAVPEEGEPFLHVSPTCGSPSEVDGTPGTTLTLIGSGFESSKEVNIWWKDPINNEFRQRQGGDYVTLYPDEEGRFEVDIIMPYRILPPSAGDDSKIWEVQARQLTLVGVGEISDELKLTVEKMIETIIIGMMATFFGIILALPLSFLAAKNLMKANSFTVAIYYLVRMVMNVVRSIEPLIWAIIAVIVVGLGPFAGIIALTIHSMAALAKLYSEAIENIDSGPIEAIQATGANWLQIVSFAVIPQIIPPFVSFTVYRWDINIRMSTVIGFVGGGGIGFLLSQWIRLLDYRSAGMAVWFIALTVMILDYLSAEIRERFT
jgi:phosphonate transport system permease protein